MSKVAHAFHEKVRTGDVTVTENVDFNSLLLSEKVLKGLTSAGFVKPSPIQLKAIPLGRCGLDLIVQAKSGTGKTCVFTVIALESILLDSASTQVLVLAPTREIAVQIWEVINCIGSAMPGLQCHTFIGGLPVQEDRIKLRKCHIAVGSPGRIKQLIESGVLKTDSVRLFVLDEADKLLEESFQEQINWIYSTLPENKQILALSATYPEYLASHLTAYMRDPTFLRLNISDPALLGIRQYYQSVPYHPMSHVVFEEKCKVLTNILSSVSFEQCLVFSNLQTRAQNLADRLTSHGWPTACIAGCLDQKDRNQAMAKLKTYKCRILISTDLTSRGIDADKVNMVVNLDVPKEHETYLHRIGRAGRFGSFGIAVSLISDGQEKLDLDAIEKRCSTQIYPLPDPLPCDLAKPDCPVLLDDVVSSEVINTSKSRPSPFSSPIKHQSSSPQPAPQAREQNINSADWSSMSRESINISQKAQQIEVESLQQYLSTLQSAQLFNGQKSPSESSGTWQQTEDFVQSEDSVQKLNLNKNAAACEVDRKAASKCSPAFALTHISADSSKLDSEDMEKFKTPDRSQSQVLVSNGLSFDSENEKSNSSERKTDKKYDKYSEDVNGRELVCYEGFEHTDIGSTIEWNVPRRALFSSEVQVRLSESDSDLKNNNIAVDFTKLSSDVQRESRSFPGSVEKQEGYNCGDDVKMTVPETETLADCETVKETTESVQLESGTEPLVREMTVREMPLRLTRAECDIPKVNITSLFKHNIGHKSLAKPHTYSSARGSLLAFRGQRTTERNVSGEEIFIPAIPPENDKKENETLKAAISQLQDILENSLILPAGVWSQNTDDGLKPQSVQFLNFDQPSVGRNQKQAHLQEIKPESVKDENLNSSAIDIEADTTETLIDNERNNEQVKANDSNQDNNDSTAEQQTAANTTDEKLISVIEKPLSPEVSRMVHRSRRRRVGYQGNFAIGHLLQQLEIEQAHQEYDSHTIPLEPRTEGVGTEVDNLLVIPGPVNKRDDSFEQELAGSLVKGQLMSENTKNLTEDFSGLKLQAGASEWKSTSSAVNRKESKLLRKQHQNQKEHRVYHNSPQVDRPDLEGHTDSSSEKTETDSDQSEAVKAKSNSTGARPKEKNKFRELKKRLKNNEHINRNNWNWPDNEASVYPDKTSRSGTPSADSGMFSRPSYQDYWYNWYRQYDDWQQYCAQMWNASQYYSDRNPWMNVTAPGFGLDMGYGGYPPWYSPYAYYSSEASHNGTKHNHLRNAYEFQTQYIKEMTSKMKKQQKKKHRK